ncbi:hypothetical protein ANTQUA_LOCUS5831 [Anthophora quadrimaculata]
MKRNHLTRPPMKRRPTFYEKRKKLHTVGPIRKILSAYTGIFYMVLTANRQLADEYTEETKKLYLLCIYAYT